MSGPSRSSDGLDPRRRRILWRAWHRGTRELDLLTGRYAEAHLDALDAAGLAELEALLEEADTDLAEWLIGTAPAPDAVAAGPVFRAMRAFAAAGPTAAVQREKDAEGGA